MATITSLGFSIFSKFDGSGVVSAHRAIETLDARLSKSNKSFNAVAGGMNTMQTAALSLAPALISVGAATAVAAGATASMVTVAGSAGAAYGAVMSAAIKRTLELRDSEQALNPVQADFIRHTDSLTKSWNNFLDTTGNQTLDVAMDGIHALEAGISRLPAIIDAVHPVAKKISMDIKEWAEGEGSERFANSIIDHGVPALDAMRAAGVDLLAVLGSGFRTFLPLGADVSRVIQDGAANLRVWSDSGGWQRFLDAAIQYVPIVRDFLVALAGALTNVARSLVDMAPNVLIVATAILSFIASMDVEHIQAFFIAFMALRGIATVIGIVGYVVTVLETLGGVFAFILPKAMFAFKIAWVNLNVALLTTPGLGWILLAIAAVVAVIIWIATKTTWFQDLWAWAWPKIQQAAKVVWDWLKSAWENTIGFVIDMGTRFIGWIVPVWQGTWQRVQEIAKVVWDWLVGAWNTLGSFFDTVYTSVIQPVWNALVKAWEFLGGIFREVYSGLIQPVVDAFKNVWPEVVAAFTSAWDSISTVLKGAWDFIVGLFKWAWDIIGPIVKLYWDVTVAVFTMAFDIISSIVKFGWDLIVTIFTAVWDVIGSTVKLGWDIVVGIFRFVWDVLFAAARAFGSVFMSIWEPIWNVVVSVFIAVWEIIKAVWQVVVDAVEATLLVFLAFFTGHWGKAWDAIKDLFGSVWDMIVTIFESVWNVMKSVFMAGVDFIVSVWKAIWRFVGDYVDAVWKAVGTIIMAVWDYIKGIWQAGMDFLSGVWSAVWDFIKTYITAWWDGVTTIFNTVLGFLKDLWESVWGGISWFFTNAWTEIKDFFVSKWEELVLYYTTAFKMISDWWNETWTYIKDFFVELWTQIKDYFVSKWDELKLYYETAFKMLSDWWNDTWTYIKDFFVELWNQIKDYFVSKWDELKLYYETAFRLISEKWNETWTTIKQFFTDVWNNLVQFATDTWENIKGVFQGFVDWVLNTFWNPLKEFFTVTMPDAFGKAVDAIGVAWDKIKEIIRAPIQMVIDVVYNNGIVKMWNAVATKFGADSLEPYTMPAWRDGGPVRGAGTTTSDSIIGRLSHNEHVWTAEEVRAAGGHRAVAGLRSAVLGGQAVQMSNSNPFLAEGGFWDGLGSVVDTIGNAVRGGIANKLAIPVAQLAAFGVKSVQDIVPGDGNALEKAGEGMVQKPLTLFLNWLNAHDTPVAGYAMGWQKMWEIVKANFPDATMTSGLRPGDSGYHGKGQAIDVAWGMDTAGKARMLELNHWIADNYSNATELIHTPGINLLEGKPFTYSAATQAEHYNHVHWAMAGGGVGGQIPDGDHLGIINAALSAAGIPPPGSLEAWQAGLNTLITRESGWNAGAVNNWDSNAANGTPSMGLAQTIGPTFSAYRVGSLPDDPFDPVANVAAAARYIVARYGDITNVQQANANMPPAGYALGTNGALAGIATVAENGPELITRGPTPVNFRGGERVWNADKTAELLGGNGDTHIQVTIDARGSTPESVDKMRTELAPELRMQLRKGVGKRQGG